MYAKKKKAKLPQARLLPIHQLLRADAVSSIPESVKAHKSKLPPYAKQWFAEKPSAGVVVAIGDGAWRFAQSHQLPIMVLPDDEVPATFHWPSNRQPALVHECGLPDDDRLRALVVELMRSGTPSVVALRHSLKHSDPRKFFTQGQSDA